MSCRAGAKRVEAKGVFVGAEVVRGPHWRFGDQDGERNALLLLRGKLWCTFSVGGAGKTGRVVAIEGWKTLSAVSQCLYEEQWLRYIYLPLHCSICTEKYC